MRAKQAEQFARRYILPHCHGFEVRGHDIYRFNSEWVIGMISFESSASSRHAFYLLAAARPLFAPYSMGYRFGGRIGHGWDLSEGDEETVMRDVLRVIRKEGQPILDILRRPRDFIEGAELVTGRTRHEARPVGEIVAYAHVLTGRYDEAEAELAALETLEREQPEELDPEASAFAAERLAAMRAALSKNPEEAVSRMESWRTERLAELGLVLPDELKA